MSKVQKVWATQILDSRGFPTVEAACQLDSGEVAVASVPGGTSTGTYEALELRDGDNQKFLGKSVYNAVKNVNEVLGPGVWGLDVNDQDKIDKRLIELDGTKNKSKYGGNAILAVSLASTKGGALANKQPLYLWVNTLAKRVGINAEIHIPSPIFNMINGGLHGAGNLDFQEFHVIPATSKTYSDSLRMGVEIYMMLGKDLDRRGAIHSVGDEGGYAPNLFTNADALEVLYEAIKQTPYQMGRDVFLGLDVAASVFYKNGEYTIRDKSAPLNDDALLDYYKYINNQYHLALIEDPFHEDAWDSWKKILEAFQGQLTIVGDDILATNMERVQKAIADKACNGILVKPNQVGTVSETLEVIKTTRDAGWKVIVSHRSGETNDWFIADFAVGVGSDYTKFGAPARGERVVKYNRLLSIESELQQKNI
ncbi:phosphopyruvate hydratase [Candidatus Woesebacteria bacterium RIFCSPLOWO2_01_FULL_39_61]|uniref:Enolase n=1 Tax=Candidatus Woesebacteria bacterium RIFCSPHIGHO2_02_FULL_39_13 TaxID=1802505 RepID=A0A1F7Z3K4_9BACT|nr:MAG: phosphopyruvate hydratase [Candidatus Woesebacteria bacterium RIFCSPHIGHO2_01_FULL_39_95]OGM33679.1 MAG: phosphopyruvate hydratase [Candidatus Woesebacteria bacterium RIFCSPHIGHO2_02_FULL_39_13]OGM38915.1 MAG: phosphopyruvate hydratase [Candidatus Woesebacteria bacterium RIFCSPHIGHO2_12_FULL_40_20]OGM68127.1 MAG: phosphopyruvate hydratase [Candidatus Woesebacteria bacterium RIFCSPLOWO2_01_FULL_39_61]OGM73158.1 MAG: phosphopyruvate hydratase [Candidatus Woesebacteria bacterium RIFCSPLOWO